MATHVQTAKPKRFTVNQNGDALPPGSLHNALRRAREFTTQEQGVFFFGDDEKSAKVVLDFDLVERAFLEFQEADRRGVPHSAAQQVVFQLIQRHARNLRNINPRLDLRDNGIRKIRK